MLVHEVLLHSAILRPSKVALVAGGGRVTYADLQHASRGLAAELKRQGLQKGDRVIIFLENSIEAVTSIFGVLEAGGCMVIVNPTAPSSRLRFIGEHCRAKILISMESKEGFVRQAFEGSTAKPILLLTSSLQSDTTTSVDDPEITESDIAAIIYTSGSTGDPKGVTLTHRNITTVIQSVTSYLGHTEEDVILCVLQLSFGYGLLQLFVTFNSGGRLVLEKGFGFPYDVVRRILFERVTGLAGVPTLFSMLLQLKEIGNEDFSSVRYVTNAAAALPPSYVPKLKQVFNHAQVYLMHGQTECLRTTYLPPDQVEHRPTSVGKGMPNVELWLEDEEGNRVTGEGTGELVVSGPNVMKGYWNDPEATAAVLRPGHGDQAALHTKDLFRVDRDGYFYFVARKDDIIKSRGERVSPLEIEHLLSSLEQVEEVRVIGVSDDTLGQAIKAEIVLRSGHQLTAQQVKSFCKRNLEDFKIPHIVEFVASLPKTASGKVKRTLS